MILLCHSLLHFQIRIDAFTIFLPFYETESQQHTWNRKKRKFFSKIIFIFQAIHVSSLLYGENEANPQTEIGLKGLTQRLVLIVGVLN